MEKSSPKVTTFMLICGLVWLSCLAVFSYLYFSGLKPFNITDLFRPWLLDPYLVTLILVGGLAYILGVVELTFAGLRASGRAEFGLLVSGMLVLPVLPLYILFYGLVGVPRTLRLGFGNLLVGFFIGLIALIIILPVWVGVYWGAGFIAAQKMGLISEEIPISGTGSMYPTFPKGQYKTSLEQSAEIVATPGMRPYPSGVVLFGKRYFGYKITRGDIVSFSNDRVQDITRESYGESSGMAKRVIALPGDELEFRSGLVYLNGRPLDEPYIARSRSTFGGDFLSDCLKITIPEDKLFVMGDNRKASGDSRHDLGLISFADIDHVIPLKDQTGVLDKYWRDTKFDQSESAKIKLDKLSYLTLLNEKRQLAGVAPLKYLSKLEDSAATRGRVILKDNDLSTEATRSGYNMARALKDVGYSNIVTGEEIVLGYYEAGELLENAFEFPDSKKFLTEKEFEEVGIAEVEGLLNGCPAQVIVLHFGGYLPPNYQQADIKSWQEMVANLQRVMPGWQELKQSGGFYDSHKADIDRINEVISVRLERGKKVLARMEASLWLSEEERQWVKEDKVFFEEMSTLADKLNSY